jgi:4-hydroxyphenylacetate 3-monooxygenase
MRGALALRALDFDQRVLGGASFLVKQNVYRNFDFKRAGALVDVALAVSPLEP